MFICMVLVQFLSMSSPTTRQSPKIPYLPNELRIRILSFINDPEFLWTTCRQISPAFKQWSEEQYARNHLSKLRLEMHVSPNSHRQVTYQGIPYIHEQSDFLFYMETLDDPASTNILLKPRGPPFSLMRPLPQGHRHRQVTRDEDFEYLEDLTRCDVKIQLYPEIDLGLRPADQSHVCPCRSLKDNTKRGLCERYIGAERFFAWNSEAKDLEVMWIELLDHAHSRSCKSIRPI
jgi:hypothetical protein